MARAKGIKPMAQNKKANGKVVHYEQAAANKSAKPKKKKKRTSPILVFTMVLFLIIFVYMMKYLVDFASGGTSVGIESVGYGSIFAISGRTYRAFVGADDGRSLCRT